MRVELRRQQDGGEKEDCEGRGGRGAGLELLRA